MVLNYLVNKQTRRLPGEGRPITNYLKVVHSRALGEMRQQERLLFTPILTFPLDGGRDFE